MSATTTAQASTGNSFVQRALTITITLGEGTFGQSGANTVTLSGLRVACTIEKAGFPSMDKAEIRVWGMTQAIMAQVSTLGIPFTAVRRNNGVRVQAGDSVNGMATVFQGGIGEAWAEFNATPEVYFNIICWTGQIQAMFPVTPSSFPGQADVATIMSGLATQMGYAFENGGVQVQLSNVYLPGTALEQAHSLARAADINLYVDSGSNTLAIWPKFSTRGGFAPLISAASGLIGYPGYRDQRMTFRCLLNPSIKIGGQIQMQSSVGGTGTVTPQTGASDAPAQGGPNGTWMVVGPLTYDLAAQIPNGPWFTDVVCLRTLDAAN